MDRSNLIVRLISIVVLINFSSISLAQGSPGRPLEELTDGLYWTGTNSHNTIVLVTDEGIILTDPINKEFSTWLKNELDERFGVPVRYVLYSHHHWDHASGGAVFEDTAQFVGHRNMRTRLALPPASTPMPASAVGLDVNGDGFITRNEAEGAYQENFNLYDYDNNAELSGAEVMRGPLNEVRIPDITYQDRMTITLGGKSAEMVYTGIHTHTDDMSVTVFPAEGVAFMVDFISIVRPPRFIQGELPIDTWLEAIRVVEAQDFDIAVGGHGAYDDRIYVTQFREYLEQLRELVAEGIADGQTLAELQENIYMQAYADWISYDEFRLSNIADMYNMLTAN